MDLATSLVRSISASQNKRSPFLGCNRFPKCRTIVNYKQLERLKKLQQEGAWPPPTPADADVILGRKKSAKTTKTRK